MPAHRATALGSQEFPLRPDAFSRWSCSADINGQAIGRGRFRLPRVLERAVRQPFSRDSCCSICRCFQTLGPATGSRTPRSDQPRSARPTQLTAQQPASPASTMASIARSSLLRQVASARPAFGQSVIANTIRATAFHTTARKNLLPPGPRACLLLFGSLARKWKSAAN